MVELRSRDFSTCTSSVVYDDNTIPFLHSFLNSIVQVGLLPVRCEARDEDDCALPWAFFDVSIDLERPSITKSQREILSCRFRFLPLFEVFDQPIQFTSHHKPDKEGLDVTTVDPEARLEEELLQERELLWAEVSNSLLLPPLHNPKD